MTDQEAEKRAQGIVKSVLAGERVGYNNGLYWAANWIESSAVSNGNPEVLAFAKNMAMSIRAAYRKEPPS